MTDIDNLLKHFKSEVTTATVSFFAWKNINNLAAQDRSVYDALNRNALSWGALTHSLQITFLVTIGRIFDMDTGALSLRSFLRKCKTEVRQFSRESLRARRQKGMQGAPDPEWLSAYIAAAYEACANDFRMIEREAKKYHDIYETAYRPIRNQIIAHKDMNALPATSALFAKTNIGDIERTLLFLHQVVGVVSDLYANGHFTELSSHKLEEEMYIQKDLVDLFGKLSK